MAEANTSGDDGTNIGSDNAQDNFYINIEYQDDYEEVQADCQEKKEEGYQQLEHIEVTLKDDIKHPKEAGILPQNFGSDTNKSFFSCGKKWVVGVCILVFVVLVINVASTSVGLYFAKKMESETTSERTQPADGQWSVWSTWDDCNVSCGYGLQRRNRTCSTNGTDHQGFNQCSGESEDYRTCITNSCPVSAQWSDWSPWNDCSVTCGSGLQSRNRTCSPTYSNDGGHHCSGDSNEYRGCFTNTGLCSTTTQKQTVLFRARKVDDLTPSFEQKLIFQTVLENQGEGYDKNTGIFTAPLAGDYLFSFQLCTFDKEDFNFAFVEDGVEKQPAQLEHHAFACGTSVYITKLETNAKIWIECKSYETSQSISSLTDRWNVFSGILI